jgi:hypothetical protein
VAGICTVSIVVTAAAWQNQIIRALQNPARVFPIERGEPGGVTQFSRMELTGNFNGLLIPVPRSTSQLGNVVWIDEEGSLNSLGRLVDEQLSVEVNGDIGKSIVVATYGFSPRVLNEDELVR